MNSGRPKTQRMMFSRAHYLSTTGFHEKQINKCCKIVSKDIKKKCTYLWSDQWSQSKLRSLRSDKRAILAVINCFLFLLQQLQLIFSRCRHKGAGTMAEMTSRSDLYFMFAVCGRMTLVRWTLSALHSYWGALSGSPWAFWSCFNSRFGRWHIWRVVLAC